MNILILNHYAGSVEMGMEFRPYYLGREWIKMGHKVSIIAGDYSHLRIKNPEIEKDFTKEEIDGIDYYWIKTGSYTGNGVKRAISMAKYLSKTWLAAKKISREMKPDVVIASSTYPLDTFVAQRIRKYSGAKYIHEIHDMWPITPMELYGMSAHNPFVIAMQIGESFFCRKADAIVSLLPNAKEYLMEHGMEPEKFYCVTNGIVLEDWDEKENLPAEHEALLKSLKEEGRTIVGFFGSHTKSYALTYLIDAIRKLNRENICAVFVGDGNYKEFLISYAAGMDNNIFFLPSVKKVCIPSLLENFDLIYVGALKNRMFRFGIAMNKLFDAMMSGKPILYAVDAPNDYIKEYHCGVSVEAENIDALADGLEQLVNMTEEEQKQLGKNGKKAVEEQFNYEVLSKRFIDVMENI